MSWDYGTLATEIYEQDKPLGHPASFPNVTIWPQQEDARQIYRETRLLIMPSKYESYGRVAAEAAISGIPTICADLPGLREAMGGHATYLPLGAPAKLWAAAVERFQDPVTWARASTSALDHRVYPAREYDAFEHALHLARQHPLSLR